MILQALTQYYEDLLHRGEIAAPGWSPAKISFALCLDKDGQVTQIINIQQPSENGKAQMPQTIRNLPAPVKRVLLALLPTSCGTTQPICWALTKRESRSAARIAFALPQVCTILYWMAWIRPLPRRS